MENLHEFGNGSYSDWGLVSGKCFLIGRPFLVVITGTQLSKQSPPLSEGRVLPTPALRSLSPQSRPRTAARPCRPCHRETQRDHSDGRAGIVLSRGVVQQVRGQLCLSLPTMFSQLNHCHPWALQEADNCRTLLSKGPQAHLQGTDLG